MQAPEGGESSGSEFGGADYAVFIVTLVTAVLIGVYTAVRNDRRITVAEYMLGSNSLHPIAVLLSLLGGWISAVSILGNGMETYFYGMQISTSLIGVVPAAIAMHNIILPVLYDLKLYSVSEYLELRFESAALRKVGTLIITINLSLYMGMCLYAPSLTLSTATGLSPIASMAIMGAIVTFYSTTGGVRAVVYTDVMQTLLMFGGVLSVVVLCCIDLGGVGGVWDIARRGGRLEFFNLDTNPYVRHTFWSTICFGFFFGLNEVAVCQTTFQRFASVRSLTISKRLVWAFLAGLWSLWILFFFSGLVAYATYKTCDPFTSGKINKQDQIIPFLVTDKLGHIPGISGLFLAAVYGGVLSSVSTTGNSIACIVWQDFFKPLPFFGGLSDSSAMLVVRSLSSLTGVVAVALGVLVSRLGNIFQVIFGLSSAIAGPLTGVFLAGILLPGVNVKGAFAGFLVSLSYSVWITVGQFLKGGGTPPTLALSVDSCSAQGNTSLETLAYTTLPTTTGVFPTTIFDRAEEEKDIYDTSYCYTGMIALSITLVVSSVVSLVTGPTLPQNIRAGVVSPTCARLYAWMWQKWCCARRKESYPQQQALEDQEDDVVIKMAPQNKIRLSD